MLLSASSVTGIKVQFRTAAPFIELTTADLMPSAVSLCTEILIDESVAESFPDWFYSLAESEIGPRWREGARGPGEWRLIGSGGLPVAEHPTCRRAPQCGLRCSA